MKLARATLLIVGLGGAALVAGFVAFAGIVAGTQPPRRSARRGHRRAFTGGSARIDGALQASRRGPRLAAADFRRQPVGQPRGARRHGRQGPRRRRSPAASISAATRRTPSATPPKRATGRTTQRLQLADRGHQRLSHAALDGRTGRGHARRDARSPTRSAIRNCISPTGGSNPATLRPARPRIRQVPPGRGPREDRRPRRRERPAAERRATSRCCSSARSLFNVAFYVVDDRADAGRTLPFYLLPAAGARHGRRAPVGARHAVAAARNRRRHLRGPRRRKHADRRRPRRRETPVGVRDLALVPLLANPDLSS